MQVLGGHNYKLFNAIYNSNARQFHLLVDELTHGMIYPLTL